MRLLVALLFLTLSCTAQDEIRVAYLGDSHCNGCCESNQSDSAWVPIFNSLLEQHYTTVTYQRYCNGGETVISGMWDGFTPLYGSVATDRNISRALEFNPDLVVIEYSGNHFAFDYPLWYVEDCFRYLADTLNSLGIKFIFVSNLPRQKTFASQAVQTAYMDTTRQLNTWFSSNYPDNYANAYTAMVDVARDSPKVEMLGADKLHWNTLGHLTLANNAFNNRIIDSMVYFKYGYFLTFDTHRHGDTIHVHGTPRISNIRVSGSNDYLGTYTLVKEFKNAVTSSRIAFYDVGYTYYKFELYLVGRKQPITMTRHVD